MLDIIKMIIGIKNCQKIFDLYKHLGSRINIRINNKLPSLNQDNIAVDLIGVSLDTRYFLVVSLHNRIIFRIKMNCLNLSGFSIERTDALFDQITYMLRIHYEDFFIKNKINIDNIGHAWLDLLFLTKNMWICMEGRLIPWIEDTDYWRVDSKAYII